MKVNGYKIEPEADLRYAGLQDADLRAAELQGADLRRAILWSTDLERANLQGANLQEANLRSANLQSTDLQGANLQGADLQGANLQGADLQYADLKDTNLQGVKLQGTCLDGILGCTPAALEQRGWAVQAGWVLGVRTASSQHVGYTRYVVGNTYTAPLVSSCHTTACHPGIYMCRNEQHASELGYQDVKLVRVRSRCSDVVTCSKGLRTRQLEVLAS